MNELLNEFLKYLKLNRNLSDNTIKQYRNTLLNYIKDMETFDTPENYISYLAKEHKPRTVNVHICAIRMFYKYLIKIGRLTDNPFKDVDSLRLPQELPNPLAQKKLKRILEKSVGEYRIAFLIMAYSGLRLSECLSLKKSNFMSDKIKIIGKRRKERVTYIINKDAEIEIRKYIKNKRGKLFEKSASSFQKKAHSMRFNVHRLRHTFATMCLDRGMKINFISKLMGHSSLSTTMIYAKISDSKLKEEVSKIRNEQKNG